MINQLQAKDRLLLLRLPQRLDEDGPHGAEAGRAARRFPPARGRHDRCPVRRRVPRPGRRGLEDPGPAPGKAPRDAGALTTMIPVKPAPAQAAAQAPRRTSSRRPRSCRRRPTSHAGAWSRRSDMPARFGKDPTSYLLFSAWFDGEPENYAATLYERLGTEPRAVDLARHRVQGQRPRGVRRPPDEVPRRLRTQISGLHRRAGRAR